MELQEKLDLIRKIAPAEHGLPKKSLLNLGIGSVVRFNATLNNDLWVVERVYNYQETNKKGERKKFQWKEYMLRNLNDFSMKFLEIEDDDGLHAYLTSDKVSQGRLSATPSKAAKELNVKGLSDGVFYLEESCTAVFDGDNGDEHVLLLDYETESGALLGVEVWEDENCEAYLYEEVSMSKLDLVSQSK